MGGVIVIVGAILMIVIHEGAHFVAAKRFGMKATEAFFGFGPRIWSIRRGETEYGIKAIPLGGYVRIIGMNPFEEVPPEDLGRTYREQPFWQKSVVVLAGIASHFVIAMLIFLVINWGFGVPTGLTTTVDRVTAELDGEPSPAAELGIQPGDELISLDGNPIADWATFVDLAHDRPGEAVTITIERSGERLTYETTLLSREIDGEPTGFFGVSPDARIERLGPIRGVTEAGKDLWFVTQQSAIGLWSLVTDFGDLLGAAVGGDTENLGDARPVSVIGLAQAGTTIGATRGMAAALALVAWVNAFVGILNVIPLYPLDGGHFAVALYEKIRGRAPDVRKLLPVAAAVFLFVVLIGVLGFYFDIVDPIRLE